MGPYLERLWPIVAESDYVSAYDNHLSSKDEWVKSIHFDIDAFKKAYSTYQYPGYFLTLDNSFLLLVQLKSELSKNFLMR